MCGVRPRTRREAHLKALGWLDPEVHPAWGPTRVLFAVAALATWLPRGLHLHETYSSAGPLVVNGAFPLTRVLILTPATATTAFVVMVFGLLLVLSGRFPRVGTALYLVVSTAFCLHEGMNMKAYDRLMFWQGLVLLTAPGGGDGKRLGSPFARYAMMIVYAGLYGHTGFHKVVDEPLWWTGTPLAYALVDLNFGGTIVGSWMSGIPSAMLAMSWFTLAFECLFPLLLWIRPVRPALLAAGLSLHVGILFTMNVGTFSLVAIVPYLVLLDVRQYETLRRWWRR